MIRPEVKSGIGSGMKEPMSLSTPRKGAARPLRLGLRVLFRAPMGNGLTVFCELPCVWKENRQDLGKCLGIQISGVRLHRDI